MSYSYERVERRRRVAGGTYGPSNSRSFLGYWIPLAMTVTVATVGFVVWVWSERRDDDEEASEGEQPPGVDPPQGYASMSGGLPPGPGPSGFQGPPPGTMGPPSVGGFQGSSPAPMGPPGNFSGAPQGLGDEFGARSTGVDVHDEYTFLTRMSSALKRTPSPQQSYDWASKKVVDGVAAAGAVVGGALSSIREGSQERYEDHERWSEEAESRDNGAKLDRGIRRRGTSEDFYSGSVELPKQSSTRKSYGKTVAIVVSAVELETEGQGEIGHHASILSHLPEHVNLDATKIFVLIYAPELKMHPRSAMATAKLPASMTSSFSNISQRDAHTPSQTPGDFPNGSESGILANVDPKPVDEDSPLYKTLHNQAQALVEKDTMIMPFTSRTGHLHILRSLATEIVYIQESLCGEDGDLVASLSGWVKQTVVVIGDEGGHGGLVDTDDEAAQEPAKGEVWWQKEERTGLGKRVAVVESLKVGDEWRRRVNEKD